MQSSTGTFFSNVLDSSWSNNLGNFRELGKGATWQIAFGNLLHIAIENGQF
jgi:hypothetical protein